MSSLVCVVGLTYHISELLYQYWLGKTIVNINVQRIDQDNLPALTICYPYLFSFKKLAQIDEYFKNVYEKYKIKLEEFEMSKEEHMVKDDLRNIYDEAISEVFNRISKNTLDFKNIIENYTLDFKNNYGGPMIFVNINDQAHDYLNSSKINPNRENEQERFHPIESILIGKKRLTERMASKCFTFFSFLQKEWRNYQNLFSIHSGQNLF